MYTTEDVFQQSSTSSHKATTTQEWMAKNFHDHIPSNIWHSSSSDLNPLDYYVWSKVEEEVNKYPHNIKVSLKAFIVRVMSNMNINHLILACRRFKSRIEVVTEAEGDFIH